MKMTAMKILVVLLANLMPSSAFTIAPQMRFSKARYTYSRQSRGQIITTSILQATNGAVDKEEGGGAEEIKDLILSLSNIHDDEQRRADLTALLEDKLSDEDVSQAAKFAHLWDTTLIQIGSEVQTEARKRAMAAATKKEEEEKEQQPQQQSQEANGGEKEVVEDSESESPKKERVKSPDELQLWALVDMMVQSKSIIKNISSSSA